MSILLLLDGNIVVVGLLEYALQPDINATPESTETHFVSLIIPPIVAHVNIKGFSESFPARFCPRFHLLLRLDRGF